MPSEKQPNGWSEWSKYVLKELERLNDCYKSMDEKLDASVLKIAERSQYMQKIERHDKEIGELKKFKIQAMTIWAVSIGLFMLLPKLWPILEGLIK